jgi:hypothetical protein
VPFCGQFIQEMTTFHPKSPRVHRGLILAGFLLFISTAGIAQTIAQAPAKSEVSKKEFEIIEGKFHDGLGTFAELTLANALIKAAKLEQPPFDTSGAELKMREATLRLPEAHSSRQILQQEIANIERASAEGAVLLLNKISPDKLLRVRHTAREFAGGKAGDLRLEISGRDDLPVSVKTDKSKKVAVAEGQTPHIEAKWAMRYFRVSSQEFEQLIQGLGFASLIELKRNYLNVARLVAEILIRKLKLTDCATTDFSNARLGDLEAAKYLFRQLRYFKSGNDRSRVIIFDRTTGAVKWESLLDEIVIENLTPERLTFLPSRPRRGNAIASEFGLKIDGRTIVSFQIKHKRGRARGTSQQFEFSDITTRLRI